MADMANDGHFSYTYTLSFSQVEITLVINSRFLTDFLRLSHRHSLQLAEFLCCDLFLLKCILTSRNNNFPDQ